MKGNKKLVWILIVVLVPAGAGYLLYDLKRVSNGIRTGPFTVASLESIPEVGWLFKGWDTTGEVQYIRIRRYRYNEYHVVGSVTGESSEEVEGGVVGPWGMYYLIEQPGPPEEIAIAMQELDPEGLGDWSIDNWVWRFHAEKDIHVILAFSPVSRKFCLHVVWFRVQD